MSGFLSASPLYSLLALYMPLTIMTALIFILKELLPQNINFPVAFLLICGGIAALAASFYCDFMKDIKASHSAANVRSGLIVMVIFYAISSLFNFGVPWKLRFIPNLASVLVSLETIYMWVFVISLKEIFGARRSFEKYTEMYQGDDLRRAIVEESSLIQYTDFNISKANRNYLGQLILVSVVTFIGITIEGRLPLVLYILLAVIFAGGMYISAFFGIMRWEHYYAGEGLAVPAADRFKRMLGIGIFTTIAIIIAIILSSDKSILPFSIIAAFLTWLLELFFRAVVPGEPPPTEMIQQMIPVPDQIQYQNVLPEIGAPWEGWKYVRYGFIALLALIFIWFMISPLFNRRHNPDKLPFFQRFKRILAEFVNGIIDIFVSIAYYLKSAADLRKLRRPNEDEIRRAADSLLGAYSFAKKRDIRQSATLFARLIIWGSEARQVSWKPSHAPGEYCHLLASTGVAANDDSGGVQDLQRINEGIIRCGEIFEKALYSAEELTKAERKEFKDLVEEITDTPAE